MRSFTPRFTVLFFLILSSFFCHSCRQEPHPVNGNADFWIDNVAFNPKYRSLVSVFGAMTFTGGEGGVLVIRLNAQEGIDDFSAFDRSCPFELSPDCRVKWDVNDPCYAVCPCCKSKFNLINGTVESGPSKFPLYVYGCDYLGGNIHVY